MVNSNLPDKNTLRSNCLDARAAIDPAYAKTAAASAAKKILDIIPAGKTVVAGYRAVRGELDIAAAMEALEARGHSLCLPVVASPGLPLCFHRWQTGGMLTKGAYGIDIPHSVSAIIPDVVLVPVVAFDRARHRLGYGAGYYDRTIAGLRAAKKNICIIGAAFAVQEVAYIAAEPHDAKLDAVVTEKEII